MSWRDDVEELRRREHLARQMGGPENLAFHKGRGKLNVRERIAALADPGSFHEIGGLAGYPHWEGNELKDLTPANAVMGTVLINGRKASVVGGDFTIRGGASDASIPGKGIYSTNLSLTHRIPYIRLLDASGGSIKTLEDIGRTICPGGDRSNEAELLWTVPVASAVLGTVAGLPAVQACLAHFNVMVKNTSRVFVSGPPVIKAALGVKVTKDEVGSEQVQVRSSGVIANLAEDEHDAIDQVKRFLSYMPQSVYDMPPRSESGDPPARTESALLDLIPKDRRALYNPRKVIELCVDTGSFFEIQPYWGMTRITGLARLNGYPVGVMMNNPLHKGGALDKDGGDKTTRIIQLCDTFHLPLVYFVDEPGFMVGVEEETRGALRGGARVAAITALSQTPMIAVIVRQVYGVAGGLHYRGGRNMYRRYAWPSGHWGPMHIEGGVAAAFKRDIESAPEPETKRREIEARFDELRSPFRTAHAFGIEEIIDPTHTRPLLCEFAEEAQRIIQTQLGPTSRIPYLP